MAERRRRARASKGAALAFAFVFVFALVLMIAKGTGSGDAGDKITQRTSTETTTTGDKTTVKETTSKETTTPEADRSLVGRAFGGGAAPVLFQLFLAGIAAFAAGALVQRVWLGEYGITVGPIALPSLPPISEKAASEAVDLITEAPEFTEILGPGPRGPQPFPQFQSIDDERLALLSIRIELEQKLRQLADAVDLDPDIALSKLPTRLVHKAVISEQAARGLRKLIEIGDRLAGGTEIEPEAATNLRDRAYNVLYAVGELRRRALLLKEHP